VEINRRLSTQDNNNVLHQEVCMNGLTCSNMAQLEPLMKNSYSATTHQLLREQWTSVTTDKPVNQLQSNRGPDYKISHHALHFCKLCADFTCMNMF
jgi:hypothetical protein